MSRPDRMSAAVGEIGLTGDIRRVPQLQRRINEAARRGFRRIITPPDDASSAQTPITVLPASTLHEAVEQTLIHDAQTTPVFGARS